MSDGTMESTGESLQLDGISITFPYNPYPCQVTYMQKVIQCLKNSENGILESPTGTGKTLSLLCAALSWRHHLAEEFKSMKRKGTSVPLTDKGDQGWESQLSDSVSAYLPKIIYASRTHSQLTQVIQELKRTIYKPKVAVLGSRDQLCIHPEVVKLTGNAEKVQLCRVKVHSHTCSFYNNLEHGSKKNELDQYSASKILDIEDLGRLGNSQRVCPYYLSRELKKTADIVFMPYNYILDMKNRRAHGIDLQGAVIIIDEAHNVEGVCEDSASFDLTTLDVSCCIKDLTRLIKAKIGEAEELGPREETDNMDLEDLQDFVNLKEFFLKFEAELDSIQLPEKEKQIDKDGSYIYEIFDKVGVTYETAEVCIAQCEKALLVLNSGMGSGVIHTSSHMQKFLDCLKTVFSGCSIPNLNYLDLKRVNSSNYKVHIKAEEKKARTDVWTASVSDTSKKQTRSLGYWCFSPGYTMNEVISQGVRCIILTSGTLSPIESFASELKVDFPVVLQNPHVITSGQIWVGVVMRGPDSTVLNSSYQYRSTLQYQNTLGSTILNFSRIIPNGVLVFFPSYFLMNECVKQWTQSGIMSSLRSTKSVFIEPRQKGEFQETMDGFYEKVNDPNLNGAVFMAVCRGKVSEGLDFADSNGRAVIVTGLPFPPRFDAKVNMKMKYLTESRNMANSKVLPAEEWYRQQATRAVNQAIGRVIRHKNDFGAIILCDERFTQSNNTTQLPVWVQPHIKTFSQFGLVQRDLNAFFKRAKEEFGKFTENPTITVRRLKQELANQNSGFIDVKPLRKISTQDFSTVDVHVPGMLEGPSSASTSMPPISLGHLSPEKKPFFQALDETETKRKISVSSKEIASPSSSVDKGKKVIKFNSVTLKRGAGHPDPVPPAKRIAIKVTQEKSVTVGAKSFLANLSESLSKDSLSKFKSLLNEYVKNKNFQVFQEGLRDIFINPSLHGLLKDLSKFIRKEHKDSYNDFCFQHIGQPIKDETQSEGSNNLACHRDSTAMKRGTVLTNDQVSVDSDAKDCKKMRSTGKPLLGNSQKFVECAYGDRDFPDSEEGNKGFNKSRSVQTSCAICQQPFILPVKAKCGHICCKLCWQKHLNQQLYNCPVCHKIVHKKKLTRAYLV